ncbi:MAG: lipoyl synthase, partial [Planctomycetota bacterium]
ITSVNRDELEDGGAAIWAETIRQVRLLNPQTSIEVLVPDFQGKESSILTVCKAHPEIFGHNIETVPRLCRKVRPQANYQQSLWVLERAKEEGMFTKTSIMVGLGETKEEVVEVMKDAREAGVDIFTVGQYLQPTSKHLPVARFVHPSEFAYYAEIGKEMGFRHVESGPLVRSSYLADKQAKMAFEI